MNLVWAFALAITSLPKESNYEPSRINPGISVISSVVIPGSGQLINNAQKRGEAMMWLDGVLWVSYASFSWYRNNREQDARLIAKKYADADISIKDPGYYRALERYNNTEQYNEDIRRRARELYPDDPDAQRRYFAAHGYFGESQWQWQSDSFRVYLYWQTRRSARQVGMTVSFLTAGLVLNRIVSLLDCIFFLPGKGLGKKIEFLPTKAQPGIELRYRPR